MGIIEELVLGVSFFPRNTKDRRWCAVIMSSYVFRGLSL